MCARKSYPRDEIRGLWPLNQANNPPKTRKPKQLRSWLVICGSDNDPNYDVADFSTIQPYCFLLYLLASVIDVIFIQNFCLIIRNL